MTRPSFQFYPADWRANAKLRRCTDAERGVWIDAMCLLHDAEEYGVLRWPLKDLAQALGCKVANLKALREKGVLKGADTGETCAAFTYAPRHAGREGDPVELLPEQKGPIWYSSRMVKDEYVRRNAGAATRFGQKREPEQGETERARLRAAVLKKTDGRCFHCKKSLDARWEIDHFIPRSRGGANTMDNLVPSCVACNQDKLDTMPWDWSTPGHTPSRRHGGGSSSSSSSSSSPSGKNKVRAFALPDWVDAEAWTGFEAMRNRIRKPMTDRARALIVAELQKLRAEGHEPIAVLDQSTRKSWQDVYPVKVNGAQQQGKQADLEARNKAAGEEWLRGGSHG